MKIKIKEMAFEDVLSLPINKREKPVRQNSLLKILVSILSFFELMKAKFKYTCNGMERLKKKELVNSADIAHRSRKPSLKHVLQYLLSQTRASQKVRQQLLPAFTTSPQREQG